MVRKIFLKNKKAWTAVLEVLISILLLASVLSLVLSEGIIKNKTKNQEIYEKQDNILKIIQIDNDLRNSVINANIINGELPQEINDTIKNNSANDLKCEAKICILKQECNLNNLPDKEIFVKSVLISNSINKYDPRELKLFCWKEK